MIGLGVGIDYALFIVTRFRENYRMRATSRRDRRGDGHRRPRHAVRRHDRDHRAARHVRAGRQLPLRPGDRLGARGAADDARASLTVLPALLSRFGERVARPSRRRAGARPAGDPQAAAWRRWSGAPCSAARGRSFAALAVMLALAAPALVACAWARATPATTPPTSPPATPTTCWPRASARASTARCSIAAQLPSAGDQAALRRLSARAARARPTSPRSPPPRVSSAGNDRGAARLPALRRRRRTPPPTWSSSCATTAAAGRAATGHARLRRRVPPRVDRLHARAVEQAAAVHRRSSSCCRRCCCSWSSARS